MNDADPAPPRQYGQLIAGEWVQTEGAATFDDLDPYTGALFARIPAGSAADAPKVAAGAKKLWQASVKKKPASGTAAPTALEARVIKLERRNSHIHKSRVQAFNAYFRKSDIQVPEIFIDKPGIAGEFF